MKSLVILMIGALMLIACNKTGIEECDWQPEKGGGLFVKVACGKLCTGVVYYNNENEKCEIIKGASCGCETPFGPDWTSEENSKLYQTLSKECNGSRACIYQTTDIMVNEALETCKARCEINGR